MTKTLIAVILMALVTYFPRVLPMAVFRNKIKSRFITAFLGYVPYAVLGAMIFPDILTSTGHLASAAIGFAAAVILAFFEKSLLKVAVCAIVVVYVCEMIIARI